MECGWGIYSWDLRGGSMKMNIYKKRYDMKRRIRFFLSVGSGIESRSRLVSAVGSSPRRSHAGERW